MTTSLVKAEKNLQEQAVLGANETPNYNGRPPIARKLHNIGHKDFYVLSLHLAGYTAEEIADLAGYASKYSVYAILRREEVIAVRQQLLQDLSQEFEALQQKVIEVVRSKLDSKDDKIQLEAVNIWMRAHGKYNPKQIGEALTAEDVIAKILNLNIQVNVNQNVE